MILVTLGCSKPRFTYDVEPAFPSSSYKTMAPDPRKDLVLIREGFRPIDPGLHRKVVLAELEARNYRSAPPAEADLWVTVYVLAEAPSEGRGRDSAKAKHREGSGEGRRGGGRGGRGGRETSTPREAIAGPRGKLTVIVQLQDRKAELPVWQGEANLNSKDWAADGGPITPEEAVRQLLKPLPAHP